MSMVHQAAKSVPKKKWFLYMLLCRDGTYYTGITTDPERREREHNQGTASRYTRTRRPVRMVYIQPCRGRSDALKKEYALKRLSRAQKVEYLKDHGDHDA